MRQRRVNFTDASWELVQQEAQLQGISAGQLVREAALAYAVWLLCQRGGNSTTETIERIIEQLREPSK